jgi:hypothetical protein
MIRAGACPAERVCKAGERRNCYKAVDAKGKPLKPIPYKELELNLPWECRLVLVNDWDSSIVCISSHNPKRGF